MNKSLFTADLTAEKEVSKFLDRYFYGTKMVKDFHRYTSKDEQLKGKDVKFTFGRFKEIIVDEKSQGHYVNKDLPTFAFELQYIGGGNNQKIGWLIDEEKETQYYLLIWIRANKNRGFKSEDITYLDCILLEREKIKSHLIDQGVDFSNISEICNIIRRDGKKGKQTNFDYGDSYFYLTKKLVEEPINIVVTKKVLSELSDVHFTLERKGDIVKTLFRK